MNRLEEAEHLIAAALDKYSQDYAKELPVDFQAELMGNVITPILSALDLVHTEQLNMERNGDAIERGVIMTLDDCSWYYQTTHPLSDKEYWILRHIGARLIVIMRALRDNLNGDPQDTLDYIYKRIYEYHCSLRDNTAAVDHAKEFINECVYSNFKDIVDPLDIT